MAARENQAMENVESFSKASSEEKQLANKEENVRVASTSRNALPEDTKAAMECGGIVFVQQLPHELLEMELREFFQQFGEVSKVFVGRSKRTARSKGYGYVQYEYYEIAKTAASAVNNYLFSGRSLQGQVLPKKMTVIPRNCTKALNSKGRHTVAYKLWLQKQATSKNGFVGGLRRSMRHKDQAAKLEKVLYDLKRTGAVLPDIKPCFVDLTHSAEYKRHLNRLQTNAESSDEEDAFVPLQPSDWSIPEHKPCDNASNEYTPAIKSQEENGT